MKNLFIICDFTLENKLDPLQRKQENVDISLRNTNDYLATISQIGKKHLQSEIVYFYFYFCGQMINCMVPFRNRITSLSPIMDL